MGARSKVLPSIIHFAEQTSRIKSDNHNFELVRLGWRAVNFDSERPPRLDPGTLTVSSQWRSG
jgi:hypothetical protein